MVRVASFGFAFYRIAKLLNRSDDVRMEVFVHAKDYEMFKADLVGDEDWLHPIDNDVRQFRNLRRGRFWNSLGITADLYLLSEDAPLFAYPEKGSKTIFLPVGFDLTIQPFAKLSSKNGSSLLGKTKLVFIALLQRHRIGIVDNVWASPFEVFSRSLKKLRRAKTPFDKFVPFPINYKTHAERIATSDGEAQIILGEAYGKFLVFFPGRLMVTKSQDDLHTGQTKGAEEAVRGFLDFASRSGVDARLLLIDHSISPDRQRVFDLVSESKSHHLVKWIKSPTSDRRLNNFEMALIYQASDVILGDFGSGWFGQTAIEAGAHRKPFVSYIDPTFMSKHFASNPFYVAKSENEISEALYQLYISERQRNSKGEEMALWFEKYLSEKEVANWYHSEIMNAISREKK